MTWFTATCEWLALGALFSVGVMMMGFGWAQASTACQERYNADDVLAGAVFVALTAFAMYGLSKRQAVSEP